jgi:pimeloyl-ACP methyl ester carboxylesterase
MSPPELRTLFERYLSAFNQFERLSIPTVAAVGGADDPFVTRELLITAIFPRFSPARSASISSAGRWPHLEQPVAVAKAIDGFLAQIGWSN